MSMRTTSCKSGFTTIEMVVVFGILTVGLVGGLTVLDRGGEFVSHGTSRLITDESNRLAAAGLVDLISESSIRYIDTTMRVRDVIVGTNMHSDRFTFSGFPLSQCTSPICRFHTEGGVRLKNRYFHCAHEFRTGGGLMPLSRGKIWPQLLAKCPLDGSTTTSMVSFDVLKLVTPRGRDGSFALGGPTGFEPQWNTMVILAPYAAMRVNAQLRRFDIQMSDLLAGIVSSSGDSPFDITPPDMVTLFDFGTDGTTDGIPDGSVPLTPMQSDAEQESFFAGTFMGEPAIIMSKSLGTSTMLPWRTASLILRLRDGFTQLSVSHYESNTVFWTASCSFTRAPEIVVNNLTEFDV